MIPDDQVEEVRAAADIVAIVGEVISLKRSGKDYKACCPFHDEKTPSFYVVPAKGFYNCFGCGESGDVFAFVMKRLGLDFVEAVKHVAQHAGIEIREVNRGKGEENPFLHLYDANAFAQTFFQDCLWDQASGEVARAYLEGRGIDRAVAERFALGYAPDEWRALREAAAHHGIGDQTLLEAGLLTGSERSEEPYDRFRGRITFSIESLSGKVLGFGGRVLDSGREGSPKYMNSPESPIYHKGQVLYGLSWAKNAIRREEVALVVEGYMDVVALASAGFENVVAPLGTALTPEQAALLRRYTKKVCLLFDSDTAGFKATFRAADTLLAGGLHPSVVTLPPGEDPDTIVRKEGSEGLRTHIDRGVDVLDRKLQILDERDPFASIEGTRSAIDRLLPTVRATRDAALRDIYVAKVAERTGVRRETLEEELKSETQRAGPPPPRRPSVRRTATFAIPPMGAERELLLLMTKDRDWIEKVGERLSPDDFVDLSYAAAFESLLADHELTHAPPEMASAAASVLEGLLADPKELRQAHRVFEESLGRILSTVMQERLDGMDRLIENTSDEERRVELLAEKAQLGKERRELSLDWSAAARKTLMSDY